MKKFSSDCFSHTLSRRWLVMCLSIFLTGFIYACATALYIPCKNQSVSKENLQEMIDGRITYINKCGGCHSLVVPEKYSAIEWCKWVDKMEPKAKLTSKEKIDILKYLSMGK